MSREIADHLQYFADIGVSGVSRDPKWRVRSDNPPEDGPAKAGPHSEAPEEGPAKPGPYGQGPVASGFSRTTESLDDITTDIGAACTRCKLCTLGRSQIVFGVG